MKYGLKKPRIFTVELSQVKINDKLRDIENKHPEKIIYKIKTVKTKYQTFVVIHTCEGFYTKDELKVMQIK
jgi:hypothetical protein